MTLEESINKAISVYLAGEVPEKMNAIKPSKYDTKYFDSVEEEMFPSDVDKKKVK